MADISQIVRLRRFGWTLGPLPDADVAAIEDAYAAAHVDADPRPVWVHVSESDPGVVHVCEWQSGLRLQNLPEAPERTTASLELVERPRTRGSNA